MRRFIVTLVVIVVALAATATAAFADGPVQAATQSAATGQTATAASSATQVQPSNQNISVRVLSPGDDGAVTQSNDATSSATATNSAATTQSTSQFLTGLCGCQLWPTATAAPAAAAPTAGSASTPQGNGGTASQDNGAASTGTADNTAPTTQDASQTQGGSGGVQASKQDASTDQAALAASSATQIQPSNSNISVRVLSPGDGGDVSQSNDASSNATASNSAGTTQSSSQGQGSGSGVQEATQQADTQQLAAGLSSAKQIEPSNSNVSVRVLSPGDDGKVSQSNDASSEANATNDSTTKQTGDQTQQGSPCGCKSSDPAVQALGQWSSTTQGALAVSSADQIGATNSNDPVRIWSKGDGGDVTQSNSDSSHASATNDASTTQSGTQDPVDLSKCGCSSGPEVQALGQSSYTGQLGIAASSAKQIGAENNDAPVRIWSPGDGGNVWQSNDVSSSADATNTATTEQRASQQLSGSGIQALGQEAATHQAAIGLSSAAQLPGRSECGCGSSFGNSADPVRIGSRGDDGSLWQSNHASSAADASNTAGTTQSGQQTLSSHCGCGGLGIQVLGQKATTDQLAVALSSVWQIGASNSSSPVRTGSYGGKGGSTGQSNDASSTSSAPNSAWTKQDGLQLLK